MWARAHCWGGGARLKIAFKKKTLSGNLVWVCVKFLVLVRVNSYQTVKPLAIFPDFEFF